MFSLGNLSSTKMLSYPESSKDNVSVANPYENSAYFKSIFPYFTSYFNSILSLF